MNKVKIVFFCLFCIIFIVAILIFNAFDAPLNSKIDKISEFQITKISGSGSIYNSPSMNNPINVKDFEYPSEIFFISDAQTSFEFFYSDTVFTVLPNSSLYYQTKTKEFYLNGEFFWHKEIKKKVEVYLTNSDKIKSLFEPHSIIASSEKEESMEVILSLSDAGRAKIENGLIQIWNFDGELKYSNNRDIHTLKNNQILEVIKDNVKIEDILSPPEYISPENKTVYLRNVDDSILKFNWKNVIGASYYILRLYSSDLRENILFEKTVTVNRKSLDILKFDDLNKIFWQVSAYDDEKKIEGIPSKFGRIKIIGFLLEKEKILKPPNLEISSLTVSGNMVLIKGEADANSQLFIDKETVKVDLDGKFIHTLTFKTIGTKTILFRLISPSEIETVLQRQVVIFEE